MISCANIPAVNHEFDHLQLHRAVALAPRPDKALKLIIERFRCTVEPFSAVFNDLNGKRRQERFC